MTDSGHHLLRFIQWNMYHTLYTQQMAALVSQVHVELFTQGWIKVFWGRRTDTVKKVILLVSTVSLWQCAAK